MITELELRKMRIEQEKYMRDRVLIRRREFFGDTESSYADHLEDVPARFHPGFGFWRLVADRFQGITAFTVTMPWDTDIKASDVIVDSQSRVFEVRDVAAPKTLHTARMCLCDLTTD
jgi:hypothetical protein